MIAVEEERESDIVTVKVSGVVTAGDVAAAVAHLERILEERSPVRLYVEMVGLDGFETAGLWQELKFDLRHRGAIGRAAFVVGSAGEKWAGRLGGLLMGAKHRAFALGEEEQAMAWLKRG